MRSLRCQGVNHGHGPFSPNHKEDVIGKHCNLALTEGPGTDIPVSIAPPGHHEEWTGNKVLKVNKVQGPKRGANGFLTARR